MVDRCLVPEFKVKIAVFNAFCLPALNYDFVLVDLFLVSLIMLFSPRFEVGLVLFSFYHRVFRTIAGSLSVGGNAG